MHLGLMHLGQCKGKTRKDMRSMHLRLLHLGQGNQRKQNIAKDSPGDTAPGNANPRKTREEMRSMHLGLLHLGQLNAKKEKI